MTPDRPQAPLPALLAAAEEMFVAGGWQLHRAEGVDEAVIYLAHLARQAKLVAAHRDSLPAGAQLERALSGHPLRLCWFGEGPVMPREEARSLLYQADLGLTGATALVAETGTVLLAEEAGYGRLVSSLPPVHAVLASTSSLVPSLAAGLELVAARSPGAPRYLSGISGPSKTGDIDMEIVRGMHGPAEVHLVLVDADPERPVGDR
jgi:hypothetical protein